MRGIKLYIGVELVSDALTPDPDRAIRIVNAMRDRRLLISASGTYDNMPKIRPPLVFGHEHADRLLDALATGLTV